MNGPPVDIAILVLVVVGGAATLLRARSLEKRIVSLERTLGAFAGLGGAGGDPHDEDQVLRHLGAINDSLLALETPPSTKET